jgi:hypothetical protein
MLDSLLTEDEQKQLCFLWTQEECYNTEKGNPYSSNPKKTVLLKDVRHIWREFWGKYDQTNTIVVDDVPYQLSTNRWLCALYPLTYSYALQGVRDSELLTRLWPVLWEISHCRDVRLYLCPRWSERNAENDQRFGKIYGYIKAKCQHLQLTDSEVSKSRYDILEVLAFKIDIETKELICKIEDVNSMTSNDVANLACKLGFEYGKYKGNPRAHLKRVVEVRDLTKRFEIKEKKKMF